MEIEIEIEIGLGIEMGIEIAMGRGRVAALARSKTGAWQHPRGPTLGAHTQNGAPAALRAGDPHLEGEHAEQIRRSSKRVAANIAEAQGARGRNQQAKFHIALGEARETLAHLEIAQADGIFEEIDPVLAKRLDFIIGALVKLARASQPRRASVVSSKSTSTSRHSSRTKQWSAGTRAAGHSSRSR